MKKRILALTALVLSTLVSTYAVPAYRGWHTMNQPDGTTIQVRQFGDEFAHGWINTNGQLVVKNEAGFWVVAHDQQESPAAQARRAAANTRRQQAASARRATSGSTALTKGIIILVNYSDVSMKAANDSAAFAAMMMDDSYAYKKTYPGSAHKFFVDQSNGLYDPQFDVYGPYTLANTRAYYGENDTYGNDKKAEYMIKHACQAADADVDFSQYDLDDDGKVDFVFVIYAGKGEADSGIEDAVWPHQSWLTQMGVTCKCDGKKIDMYACASELDANGSRAGIATFCHEFSHVLGLADVYDTNYGDNYNKYLTPGDFHLMDGGAYNGGGYCPPNYNAYDKYFMGWITPTILNEPENVTLPADGQTYRQITSDGTLAAVTKNADVYYLENRQKVGWDKAIPGAGMLAWRVKYNASIWDGNEPNAGKNGNYTTPLVNKSGAVNYELVVADGTHTNGGDKGDPFPGSKKITSYTPLIAYPLTDIALTDSVITFKFMGGVDPQAIDEVPAERTPAKKYIEHGIMIVERNGIHYTITGTPIR